MKLSICRYDAALRMRRYDITLQPTDHMQLDAILRIKLHDNSPSIRRSCRQEKLGLKPAGKSV